MHWIDAVLNPSILTRITEALKKSGARMTKKRAQILTAIGSFSRPVSAEEIRKQAGLPPSDLVTVYRNLEAFEAIQALYYRTHKIEQSINVFIRYLCLSCDAFCNYFIM